ncbi:ABC transporter permease [Candidatus Woesearchaeota archaeon]|nr:ABC transporter permease [Candidatus Woesearchaeota archaeon]
MMQRLFILVKKDLQRLMRSKLSSTIIVFGPLILVLLLGLAFNNSDLFGVRIGVFVPEENNLTRDIITNLQQRDFTVVRTKSPDDCINKTIRGENHLCVLFPQQNAELKSITFYVDYSQVNLVQMILTVISKDLSQEFDKISLGMMQDLLNDLGKTSAVMREKATLLKQMQNQAEKLGGSITELESQVNQLEIQVNLQQVDPNAFGKQAHDAQTKIEGFGNTTSQHIDAYLAELAQLDQRFFVVAFQLNQQQQDLQKAQQTLQAAQQELHCTAGGNTLTYEELLLQMKNNPDASCVVIGYALSELETKSTLLTNVSADLQDFRTRVNATQQDLTTFKGQVSGLQTDVQGNLAGIDTQIASFKQVLDQSQAEIDRVTLFKGQLGQKLGEMKTALASSLADSKQLSASLDNVLAQFDNLTLINPSTVLKPITTQIRPVASRKNTFDFILPRLLALIITLVGILLASTLVMKDKTSSAHFRNLITPLPDALFIIGTYITTLMIIFFQALLIFLVAAVIFGSRTFDNIITVSVILLVGSSVFIFIGMIIGYLFRSEETATLASISMGVVFIIFSSIIMPIEKMSPMIAQFAYLNPFVLMMESVRKAMIFTISIADVGPMLLGLLGYAVLLGIVALIARLWSRRMV